jgi:hypothetical protein
LLFARALIAGFAPARCLQPALAAHSCSLIGSSLNGSGARAAAHRCIRGGTPPPGPLRRG